MVFYISKTTTEEKKKNDDIIVDPVDPNLGRYYRPRFSLAINGEILETEQTYTQSGGSGGSSASITPGSTGPVDTYDYILTEASEISSYINSVKPDYSTAFNILSTSTPMVNQNLIYNLNERARFSALNNKITDGYLESQRNAASKIVSNGCEDKNNLDRLNAIQRILETCDSVVIEVSKEFDKEKKKYDTAFDTIKTKCDPKLARANELLNIIPTDEANIAAVVDSYNNVIYNLHYKTSILDASMNDSKKLLQDYSFIVSSATDDLSFAKNAAAAASEVTASTLTETVSNKNNYYKSINSNNILLTNQLNDFNNNATENNRKTDFKNTQITKLGNIKFYLFIFYYLLTLYILAMSYFTKTRNEMIQQIVIVCVLAAFPFIISYIEYAIYNFFKYLLSMLTGKTFVPYSYSRYTKATIDPDKLNNITTETTKSANPVTNADLRKPITLDYERSKNYIKQLPDNIGNKIASIYNNVTTSFNQFL